MDGWMDVRMDAYMHARTHLRMGEHGPELELAVWTWSSCACMWLKVPACGAKVYSLQVQLRIWMS